MNELKEILKSITIMDFLRRQETWSWVLYSSSRINNGLVGKLKNGSGKLRGWLEIDQGRSF